MEDVRVALMLFATTALLAATAGAQEQAAASQPPPATDCRGGVIKDDGSAETGYGFIPSLTRGAHVQRYRREEFTGGYLDAVCVCWLKTRGDDAFDFDVVVYEDAGGRPKDLPLARFPAMAQGVARDKESAGPFVRVDLPDLPIPDGTFYLGVEWNPKQESYLFVCVDREEGAEAPTTVFARDDRVPVWGSILNSKDPTYKGHRALLVRATSRATARPFPPRPDASSPPRLQAVQ